METDLDPATGKRKRLDEDGRGGQGEEGAGWGEWGEHSAHVQSELGPGCREPSTRRESIGRQAGGQDDSRGGAAVNGHGTQPQACGSCKRSQVADERLSLRACNGCCASRSVAPPAAHLMSASAPQDHRLCSAEPKETSPDRRPLGASKADKGVREHADAGGEGIDIGGDVQSERKDEGAVLADQTDESCNSSHDDENDQKPIHLHPPVYTVHNGADLNGHRQLMLGSVGRGDSGGGGGALPQQIQSMVAATFASMDTTARMVGKKLAVVDARLERVENMADSLRGHQSHVYRKVAGIIQYRVSQMLSHMQKKTREVDARLTKQSSRLNKLVIKYKSLSVTQTNTVASRAKEVAKLRHELERVLTLTREQTWSLASRDAEINALRARLADQQRVSVPASAASSSGEGGSRGVSGSPEMGCVTKKAEESRVKSDVQPQQVPPASGVQVGVHAQGGRT